MIVDNIRVVNKDRLPPNIHPLHVLSPEAFHFMLSRREENPCLIIDVTIQFGDHNVMYPDTLIREYMEKNYPDVLYHFERSMDAFNMMLENLTRQDGNSLVKTNDGKSFMYFYIYSKDREAIDNLAKYVRSKAFINKVQKASKEQCS